MALEINSETSRPVEPRMNPEIKEKWLLALRSGSFKQGTAKLLTRTAKGDSHCCLGVLSHVAAKVGAIKRPTFKAINDLEKVHECSYGFFDGEASVLPESVCLWAGVSSNPMVWLNGTVVTLAELNDEGKTFAEIADVIEKLL